MDGVSKEAAVRGGWDSKLGWSGADVCPAPPPPGPNPKLELALGPSPYEAAGKPRFGNGKVGGGSGGGSRE